jgi:hypothetical protein
MLLLINWAYVTAIFGVGIISFGLGLFYKSSVVAKQRKRILRLEDEMLTNHANLLALEKKLTELRQEKSGVQREINPGKPDRDRGELRAS